MLRFAVKQGKYAAETLKLKPFSDKFDEIQSLKLAAKEETPSGVADGSAHIGGARQIDR